MEGNGDTKSAQSEKEGAQRRKGQGADAIHVHLLAPLGHAVTSPHRTYCTPSAYRRAWERTSSPTHTLHFGLPRSWRLVSNRYQQARLAKSDPPSGKEGLIVSYWSQKVWISRNCLARELTLISDKWLIKALCLIQQERCVLQLAGSCNFPSCLNKQESLSIPASKTGKLYGMLQALWNVGYNPTSLLKHS